MAIDPAGAPNFTPCPCPPGGEKLPLDTVPDPLVFQPYVKVCDSGCAIDAAPDVADGESWL